MTTQNDEFDALRTVVRTLEAFSPDEQRRILRWAAEKIGVVVPAAPAASRTSSTSEDINSVDVTSTGAVDIKSFAESKNPKNDLQFVAVVAYYYRFEAKEEERKTSIKATDVTDACRKVNRKRIPRADQTLINAVNAGLLDRLGGGNFAINSVGENLVAVTLPGGESDVKKTRKKTAVSKKKTAKKKK